MFNDSMQGVSTLSLALMNSVKDCIDTNTFVDSVDDSVQFYKKNGDVYIPFNTHFWKEDLNNGGFPTFDPSDGKYGGRVEAFREFQSRFLSNDITTITYTKEIFLPSMLKQLADEEDVYGIVLESPNGSDEKLMINPLHPLIAFLIASDLIQLPEEGKIHIFQWKKRGQEMMQDKDDKFLADIKSYKDDYQKLFSLSAKIVRETVVVDQKANINNDRVTQIIQEPFLESLNAISIEVTKREGSQNGDLIKSLIVPTHLIVEGFVSPYYGLILIDNPTNSNAEAVSLSPMYSGNINQSFSSEGYRRARGRSSNRNICVGSESITSKKGWLTLSKVNAGSMFFQDTLDLNNVFAFVAASKNISSEIWGVIEEDRKKELEEMEELV